METKSIIEQALNSDELAIYRNLNNKIKRFKLDNGLGTYKKRIRPYKPRKH